VIDLATGAVRGVEALLRWQDDKGELVPPGEFLPIAEDTGLIIPIGEWVLREACHQTKTWLADGLELLVAVNISARQLWHGDVADEILQTIAETGVSSESLELEITETAMGSDPRHMESALVRFHKGGLKIALDDFGTGYSSLSRLKHLPIHTLKIDQSFVDGIPDDEDDTAIVTATMQLAHSLGLRSLAEGIETKEQWEWLRKRGCQYGQGYYFSRPVPATDIPKLLERAQRGWPPE
jgi:EAL domain-containing protein (putative c-di-GMP-specific phosphodiesterase class I)